MDINENLDEEYNKNIMFLSDKIITDLHEYKITDCKYSNTNILLNVLIVSVSRILHVCFPDEIRKKCIERALFQIQENIRLFESQKKS
jgi:hypothetical protein